MRNDYMKTKEKKKQNNDDFFFYINDYDNL